MTKLKLYARDGSWWLCLVDGTKRYWLKAVGKLGDRLRM